MVLVGPIHERNWRTYLNCAGGGGVAVRWI